MFSQILSQVLSRKLPYIIKNIRKLDAFSSINLPDVSLIHRPQENIRGWGERFFPLPYKAHDAQAVDMRNNLCCGVSSEYGAVSYYNKIPTDMAGSVVTTEKNNHVSEISGNQAKLRMVAAVQVLWLKHGQPVRGQWGRCGVDNKVDTSRYLKDWLHEAEEGEDYSVISKGKTGTRPGSCRAADA